MHAAWHGFADEAREPFETADGDPRDPADLVPTRAEMASVYARTARWWRLRLHDWPVFLVAWPVATFDDDVELVAEARKVLDARDAQRARVRPIALDERNQR